MKKILVCAEKLRATLMSKHFNPVKVDFHFSDGKWICEMLFEKTPDVTSFVKEFTKYNESFVVMVQTKSLFDIYSYVAGGNSILKLYEQNGKPFEENIFIS